MNQQETLLDKKFHGTGHRVFILTPTCESERAVLPLLHALLDIRVENCGDEQADDHHDGVPRRADEPHHLVQHGQHARLQAVCLPDGKT